MVLGLDELDEDILMQILTQPKNALTKQYQKLFSMEGIRLTFTRDALREVVRTAYRKKTGARGLRSVLEQALLPVMFEVPSRDDVREVMVTREVILKEALPVYLKKDKRSPEIRETQNDRTTTRWFDGTRGMYQAIVFFDSPSNLQLRV